MDNLKNPNNIRRNIRQYNMLLRVPEENVWYVWHKKVEDTLNEEDSDSDSDSDEGTSGSSH